MKKILPILLAAILATVAHADLTVTQKIQQESQPSMDLTMTMKIKGKKMRMDATPKVSTIVDLQSGDVQSLMHDQKVVMSIPGATIKSMQEAHAKTTGAPAGDPVAGTPVATGKKETINGFACEEYEVTSSGSKLHLWLTKDLPAAEKIMNEVTSLSPDANPLKGLLKDQKVTGFPMRTVIEMPGAGKTTITVVALSESPVADAEFVVPSGYKAMPMPPMPGR